MKKNHAEALETLQMNYQEPSNKRFNYLVRERTKEISKLEENIDHDFYDTLFFVAAPGRPFNFNRYRKPTIILDDLRKGKIKLAEVSDLKRKFIHELSDRKKGNKNPRNTSIIENTKILFNAWEKVLKLYQLCWINKWGKKVNSFKEKGSNC